MHDGGGDSIAVARSLAHTDIVGIIVLSYSQTADRYVDCCFPCPRDDGGRHRIELSLRWCLVVLVAALLIARIWVSPMHELMYTYVIEHVEFDYRSNGS